MKKTTSKKPQTEGLVMMKCCIILQNICIRIEDHMQGGFIVLDRGLTTYGFPGFIETK